MSLNPSLWLAIASTLLYFAAGVFREFLVVWYYRSVSRGHRYSASGLAGGIELWDLIVLSIIITSGWNLRLVLAYTVGVVIGTYGGMLKK